ncbi:MAG: 2-oxoacid:acceptor oxidoreductase [Rhodospirillaceae bacterium]|nr:2-oxoacid:acceptor oxidoreductase [Rhodospirillaceae bacterium]
MFQIRIHGRGGQGAVSAAEMLSISAFLEGDYAQAFPSFGSERMGAPVVAFCRIDDKEIRLREPVMMPDALIVQDSTLLHQVDLLNGLDTRGYLLINTTKSYRDLGLGDYVSQFPPHHICTVAATKWALKYIGRPVPNAALLGAFAAVTHRLKLESVEAAIRQKFPGKLGADNARAAAKAYDSIRTN